jgi:hypothetical protein
MVQGLLDKGVKWGTIESAAENTEYPFKKHTMQLHLARLHEDESLFVETKASGHPELLEDILWHVVAGRILTMDRGVSDEWTACWIHDNLHVDLSTRTVCHHMDKLEMVMCLTSKRPL